MSSFLPHLLVVAVGFGFSVWVLLLRWAQLSSAWGTIIVMATATLTLTAWNWSSLPAPPTGKQLICALIGGVVSNGIGLIAYDKLITDPRFSNTNLPAISIALFIVVLAVGWVALGEQSFDRNKVIGIIAAAVAAFFLSR